MWISHNLKQRLHDPNIGFSAFLTPKKFSVLDFHYAADFNAKEIAKLDVPLFLGLSGGMDSEYVLLSFYRNKIPIKPIIVKTNGNSYETSYAFFICKKLGIQPIVLTLNDQHYLAIFENLIVKRLNGVGIYTVPSILASNVAKNHNGILITGNHLIEDGDVCWNIDCSEWDFYTQVLSNENDINFFSYTPEMSYSMFKELDGSPANELKERLYGIGYRPKMKPIHGTSFNVEANKFLPLVRPNSQHVFGRKNDVLRQMENWNV